MFERLTERMGRLTDADSLAMFRIFFGSIMALTAWDYLRPQGGTALVERNFTQPEFLFSYPGLEWIGPLSAQGMTAVCAVLLGAAVMLAVGLWTRVAAAGVFLAWTYLFLLDTTYFNNHYYLQSIFAFLLIWLPSANAYSIDRLVRRRRDPAGEPRGGLVPLWSLHVLRGQLLLVYFFGGVAKLNTDWLLHAEPMKSILLRSRMAAWGDWATGEAAAMLLAYSGLIFDLAIGFLLLWRRTRILGLILVAAFHGFNHFVLFNNIGWFPILGLAATTIFLEPDWPRRLRGWLRTPRFARPDIGWLVGGMLAVPVVGAALGWKLKSTARCVEPEARVGWLAPVLVCLCLAAGSLVPLRHYAIDSNVNWSGEGELFSWRMKGAAKSSLKLLMYVEDAERQDRGPAVYRDCDPQRLNWQELPELVVLFQPLVGERIVFNRLAGGRSEPLDEALARPRIYALWQKAFGRTPEIHATASLGETLERIEREVLREESSERLKQHLQVARRQAERFERSDLNQLQYLVTAYRLRRSLVALVRHPRHGAWISRQLARMHPFAAEGARGAPTMAIAIEDAALFDEDSRYLPVLDHARLGAAWPETVTVWTDLERLTALEWCSLPPTLQVADTKGQARWLWNYYRDLTPRQAAWMGTRPALCHQYAQRVAQQWQAKHGRRPAVFFETSVGMNQHLPQALIDPTVDLASTPITYVRHNPWIVPLRGSRAVQAVSNVGWASPTGN